MTALLEVRDLEAAYGQAQVLFGMGFHISEGEVVTLMGRNGMGKTTTIRAVMGLVAPSAGTVQIKGRDLTGAAPYKIAQAGIGLVPEGRQIFPTLTVEENLVATGANRFNARPGWSLARVYEFFPRLRERRKNLGNQLSGGEQQMLAIGRALMTNPKLLILDEATEGLAPLIRAEIWACLDASQGRRPVHSGHRQERRCAGKPRRPPCDRGKRAGSLERQVIGAERRSDAARPLFKRIMLACRI